MITATDIRALFVAWQDPASRRYYTVGRLLSSAGPSADLYEFAYTRGAVEAASVGFQPLLAFPSSQGFEAVFRSRELFPFFTNRLMPASRPDYKQFLHRMQLTPESALPLTVLARSGGIRATDSIEMFALPTAVSVPETGGYCFETHFLVHGFRHLEQAEQDRVLQLVPNESLQCLPQPNNQADSNAMILLTIDHSRVGWLPRYLAPDAMELQDWCGELDVTVVQVNPTPAPSSQRILARLRSCWPDGYQPFQRDAFLPVSTEASPLANPLDCIEADGI